MRTFLKVALLVSFFGFTVKLAMASNGSGAPTSSTAPVANGPDPFACVTNASGTGCSNAPDLQNFCSVADDSGENFNNCGFIVDRDLHNLCNVVANPSDGQNDCSNVQNTNAQILCYVISDPGYYNNCDDIANDPDLQNLCSVINDPAIDGNNCSYIKDADLQNLCSAFESPQQNNCKFIK
jgi:hypothetical protein